MRAETVVNFPIKTKLVCSACGAPGEGSCRCGATYITPGERAEAAVKAHPEKSDRAIAEDIGVSQPTVSRARKRSTDTYVSVAERTGKDGKKRKQPKPRPGTEKVREHVRAKRVANEPVNRTEVGEQFGVGDHAVQLAVAREDGRLELLDELKIDVETLSSSAKAKLEIAKRQMERRLAAEHATRLRGVDEEVRLRVIAENRDYLAMVKELEAKVRNDEKLWREIIAGHKPLFTADQFRLILMCLHPDGERTADKLADAFRLFNDKKVQLTGAR